MTAFAAGAWASLFAGDPRRASWGRRGAGGGGWRRLRPRFRPLRARFLVFSFCCFLNFVSVSFVRCRSGPGRGRRGRTALCTPRAAGPRAAFPGSGCPLPARAGIVRGARTVTFYFLLQFVLTFSSALTCPPTHPPSHPFICPSFHLSVHPDPLIHALSIYLCNLFILHLSFRPPINAIISPCFYPSNHPPTFPSIRPPCYPFHQPIHLSMRPFTRPPNMSVHLLTHLFFPFTSPSPLPSTNPLPAAPTPSR